jgi:type IV secretion system protein VirB5
MAMVPNLIPTNEDKAMIFKRSRTAYGETPEPETPYQRAAQVWDARMGDALVRAKNWRLMAFGSLTLSISLAGGMIWQAGQSRIVPYVIELEADGSARAVRVAASNYHPTDAQIAFHLATFIQNIRSLSTDPIIVRKSWLRAYDYATARAANTLNDYARDNDPFARVGERTVSVEVTSVVRASQSSFQIRWFERVYTNGSLSRIDRWTGVFAVIVEQPRDADTLRKNPLGIYVHDINWSRDLGTKSPTTDQTPPSPSGEIQ